jgi:hypothetical protein
MVAAQLINTARRLQSKHLFTDADKKDILLVKELAKELAFSQKNIDRLQVKKAVAYTFFDQVFRNNFAAFFKTCVIHLRKAQHF